LYEKVKFLMGLLLSQAKLSFCRLYLFTPVLKIMKLILLGINISYNEQQWVLMNSTHITIYIQITDLYINNFL